jgi:alpha-beta hydrolase superfamily lysophospholipase
MIHGIQSHAGWYAGSCERLRQAGWAVSFLDRRGSGANDKDRGHAPSFRRLLDDIAEFVNARKTTQAGPIHLAAISWGGKLACALPHRHPGVIDSIALLCPGIAAQVGPSLGEKLRVAASFVLSPRSLYPVPLSDPALFTASETWQQYIEADPRSLRRATARFLMHSFFLDIYLRRARKSVNIPVLLMLAQHDRVIDNAKVRAYVERLPTTDKTIIEYPGAHHTLEFEPTLKHVDDLLAWLERLPSAGA